MSRAIDAAPHSTASVDRGGHQRTRQSKKKLIDAQRQSNKRMMMLSDNQKVVPKKCLRTFGLKMIITSLPAAASNSECRRRSHPDCRATQTFPLYPNDRTLSETIASSESGQHLSSAVQKYDREALRRVSRADSAASFQNTACYS